MSTSDSTTPPYQAPPPATDERVPIDQPPATDERAPDPAAALDLDQAASYAGRAPATLRRVVRQGKLPRHYRPGLYGPELIFTRADIDAWLADQARAVETMPGTPASTGSDGDAAAANDAPADGEPSTALVAPDTLSSPIRLYALVALAYAQRRHDVEDAQQQQAAALADVRAHLAQLEDAQRQGQQLATTAGGVPGATTGDVPAAPLAVDPRPVASVEEGQAHERRHPSLLTRIFGRKG